MIMFLISFLNALMIFLYVNIFFHFLARLLDKLNLSFPMENSFWNSAGNPIQVKQLKIIYLERKMMDL